MSINYKLVVVDIENTTSCGLLPFIEKTIVHNLCKFFPDFVNFWSCQVTKKGKI